MTAEEIQERLLELQDKKYQAFHSKLIPNVNPESVIGVRTPALRALARELTPSRSGSSGKNPAEEFLSRLPHKYYDENQLHGFIISREKDFDRCISEVEAFLPYVDNWATCDQLLPDVFKKNHDKLLPYVKKWLKSDLTYTVRFAIGILMHHFLDDDFSPEYPEIICKIRSEEYYVNMMIAWYFATALSKQYDSIIPYLTERRLEPWTHNKTIQKAVESFRITAEQKEFLRTLKVKS